MAIFTDGTNISISGINTENTSTTSNSLKTLSDTARSGTNPADGAPFGMSEFQNYSHPSPFTSQSTSGFFNSFTQGKANRQRRGLFGFSDATLVLGGAGNSTIYTITDVTSKNEINGPSNADQDSRQGLIIAGTRPSGVTADPDGWTTVTFSNSSNNSSVNRSAMTYVENNTFWSFTLNDETLYLAASGTGGIMTFT